VAAQPIEREVERLKERMTRLEELPARVDDLTGQILQLRSEMGSAFSSISVRVDLLTARVDGMPEQITRDVMTQVRILHEDVIDRLKVIQEGQASKPRREDRKRR
jgi:archaellum component FlaC